MDDLFFSLEDLLLLNYCVEMSIDFLQSKLPYEEYNLSGCVDIHVFNSTEDLPEEIQDEINLDKDLEQLIELHDRLNDMIDAFMVEEELENEELINFEEADEMKKIGILFSKFLGKGTEVHECCGNCEECEYCNEANEQEDFNPEEMLDNSQFINNNEIERIVANQMLFNIVDTTMVEIFGQLNILKDALQNEGFCDNCGGYRVFDLKPEYLQLLKAVGYGEGNVCNCDLEVTCEKEENNEEENVNYAAEFNLTDMDEQEDDVEEMVQEEDHCCGNCENCQCCNSTDYEYTREINTEEIENMVDYDMTDMMQEVDPYGEDAYVKYYAELYEEAAQYALNKPVEVIWACEEGVEPPTKNEEDMGFDVKAHFDEDYMMFAPHETKLVPTGLYAAVPTLWGLLAREKGSTGAIGMKCGAGVVDSGYRGEIFIAITNENDCHLVITKDPDVKKAQKVEWVDWDNNTSFDAILYPYKKGIAQLLVKFNPKVETKVISVEELKALPSLRGEGKLGSTDNF